MELQINHIQINCAFYTWNDRNQVKISQKLRIKWNFELTVFELTMADLYSQGQQNYVLSFKLDL